jgi:hypothetical protein
MFDCAYHLRRSCEGWAELNSSFQWFISMAHFNGSFQWLISMAQFNGSFQWLISMVHFNGSFQWLISMAHFNGSFQWLISTAHFNGSFNGSIKETLFKNIFVQLRRTKGLFILSIVFNFGTAPKKHKRSLLHYFCFCFVRRLTDNFSLLILISAADRAVAGAARSRNFWLSHMPTRLRLLLRQSSIFV